MDKVDEFDRIEMAIFGTISREKGNQHVKIAEKNKSHDFR
jgi:hypothetical protein